MTVFSGERYLHASRPFIHIKILAVREKYAIMRDCM